MTAELLWLLRAGVPARGVRLTVRELLVARIVHGPLGAGDVSNVVEATVRAACRLVRELDAPDVLVEAVCRAALEAVRGHGGESTRWLPDATSAAYVVLDELARERAEEPIWRQLARRVEHW